MTLFKIINNNKVFWYLKFILCEGKVIRVLSFSFKFEIISFPLQKKHQLLEIKVKFFVEQSLEKKKK